MSGERTENSNDVGRGSSDDDISLREHLQRQIDLQRENGIRMFSEFKYHYDTLLAERKEEYEIRDTLNNAKLDERHLASQTLLDERFEQQQQNVQRAFLDHQDQTKTAFTVASTATQAAFEAANASIQHQEVATQNAIGKVEKALEERFVSQARALDKAEQATEKRFESVNEFRQQLNDIIRGFMPRGEAEVRTSSMSERIEANAQAIVSTAAINSERINKLELSIAKRLDLTEGKGAGMDKLWGLIIGGLGFISLVVSLIIMFSQAGAGP